MGKFDFNKKTSTLEKKNLVKKIRRFVDSGIVKTCEELDPNDRQLSFVIGLIDIALVPWSVVHFFK